MQPWDPSSGPQNLGAVVSACGPQYLGMETKKRTGNEAVGRILYMGILVLLKNIYFHVYMKIIVKLGIL